MNEALGTHLSPQLHCLATLSTLPEASVLTWDSHCHWKGMATCSRMAMIRVK